MENIVNLVLHPVRLRIVMALAGREMTAQQLAETLGDVSPATLYRYLNRLSEAGVLEVTSERRVRGTLEKVYTLHRYFLHIESEEFAALSREDHQRFFTTFIASLLDDFSHYIDKAKPADFMADGVGYQKFHLNLNDEELANVVKGINEAIVPYLKNPSAPGRKRRMFATIVIPCEENDVPQDESTPDAIGAENKPSKEKE